MHNRGYLPLQNIPIRSELGIKIRRNLMSPSLVLPDTDYATVEIAIAELIRKASERS